MDGEGLRRRAGGTEPADSTGSTSHEEIIAKEVRTGRSAAFLLALLLFCVIYDVKCGAQPVSFDPSSRTGCNIGGEGKDCSGARRISASAKGWGSSARRGRKGFYKDVHLRDPSLYPHLRDIRNLAEDRPRLCTYYCHISCWGCISRSTTIRKHLSRFLFISLNTPNRDRFWIQFSSLRPPTCEIK